MLPALPLTPDLRDARYRRVLRALTPAPARQDSSGHRIAQASSNARTETVAVRNSVVQTSLARRFPSLTVLIRICQDLAAGEERAPPKRFRYQ